MWQQIGRKPVSIILIGAIIAIIGGLIGAIGTWLQNKQSSEKYTRIETEVIKGNKEVINLRKQNDSLKSDLEVQLNKIDELRRENTDLYGKLSKSSLEIYNNLTGGEGNRPILIMSATDLIIDKSKSKPSYFMIQFILANHGKYPLKNIELRIIDFAGRDMLQYGIKHTVDGQLIGFNPNTQNEYENYEFNKTFHLQSISPNVTQLIYRTTYSHDVTGLDPFYNIELSWDNEHFRYFIHLKTEKERLLLNKIETAFNNEVTDNNSWFEFK